MIKRHVNVRLSWVTMNRMCQESDAGKKNIDACINSENGGSRRIP